MKYERIVTEIKNKTKSGKCWKQADLAKIIGVNQSSISRLISGQPYSLSVENIKELCLKLGIKTHKSDFNEIPEDLSSVINDALRKSKNKKTTIKALTFIAKNIEKMR